jgi:diguanylate cyclase (GGDEF)-like protein
LRRVVEQRPAIAWTLSLLFAFKGLICLATVTFPISTAEPVGLVMTVGFVALGAAIAIWLAGSRIPLFGYELIAAGGTLTAGWLISHAATPGGVMVAAFAYPWTAIYSAHFFPRRGVIAQGLLISASFGVALAFSGLSGVVVYWLVVTITIWSICLLLGSLSEGMRRQAGTDQLTGLLNRAGFQSAALRERALADRTGNPLTLALIDLDGFKLVNDRNGHAAGDRLLTALSVGWRAGIRPGDILARYGGDEFVLLLPATTPAGAHAVLERLRTHDRVSWSVGVSEWLSGEDIDAPMARADRHLYAVKSAQRVGITAVNGASGVSGVSGGAAPISGETAPSPGVVLASV